MTARLLLLCPGQGGQHAGMFDFARSDPAARAFLERCAVAPDAVARFDNRSAQPAIVAATLANWIALQGVLAAPTLVAGYSIGELAAYAVAGAFAPEQAVALAAQRAAAMDAAAAGVAQGLAAVSGVAPARVAACAEVAIITGADSCIAGGTAATLAALAAQLPQARVQMLPVNVASHTSFMRGAVAPFAQALEGTPFAPLRCPVLAGVDASRVQGREAALSTLTRQLTDTIDWAACMDAAMEAGVTVALELGPGAALARMLQARHDSIDCRSVADFRSVEGVARWLARHLD